MNERGGKRDRRRNSTWCKDKFQTDRRGGEDFDIHKYVKDVRLERKEEKKKKGISNCSVSLPWTRTNRK